MEMTIKDKWVPLGFMAIGLFDVQGCVGENPKLEITSPLFDRVLLKFPDRLNPHKFKYFEIVTKKNGDEDTYIQHVKFNDKDWNSFQFPIALFFEGGKLEIELGPNQITTGAMRRNKHFETTCLALACFILCCGCSSTSETECQDNQREQAVDTLVVVGSDEFSERHVQLEALAEAGIGSRLTPRGGERKEKRIDYLSRNGCCPLEAARHEWVYI